MSPHLSLPMCETQEKQTGASEDKGNPSAAYSSLPSPFIVFEIHGKLSNKGRIKGPSPWELPRWHSGKEPAC